MMLRLCLLAACAGLLLNQAALGCRHHRPSFAETIPRTSAAAQAGRSVDLPQAAAGLQDDWRPTPSALE
ncbi:MAG TPA: hypothetical protein VKM54_12065 [Myxococcota bacterium]|nr:hypothetical protein [Myxococcota bacterium]